MKWLAALLIIMGSHLFGGVCEVKAFSQSDITVSSHTIPQGDLSLIRIMVKTGEKPHVTWRNREIYLVPNSRKTVWQGFLVADLTERPGYYKALIKISPSGKERELDIEVVDKDYGVRRLTLPKKMVDLDPETLHRVKKESRIMKKLWDTPATAPLWSGPFLKPVPGKVLGPFGRKSVINDQPRSPHSGIDLKAKRGTRIKVINRGRIALTADHFFSGRSIVTDHGGGIMSMYFHLEEILVQQGDMVRKGQVIGLVGASGRATGPHLHYGVRINRARIDPMRLMELSQQMEE